MNECFVLVEQHVEQYGGERLLGWALWELPGLFVEAEFHAVWKSPNGVYLDITRKARPTARVFFLPMADGQYTNRQVNNVRRAIKDDLEVKQYLQSFDDIFEFMNRGERATMHGEIPLDEGALVEYRQIKYRQALAQARIAHRFPFYDPYLPCRCGCGAKAKWCSKPAV